MRSQLTMAAACLGAAGVVQAGVVVHSTGKDLKSGRETDREVVYVQDGLVRIDKVDEHGQATQMTLFRDGAIWDVHLPQKTYTKMDKAAMQAGAKEMDAEMAKMRAQMANMPPEQRAMMEKMMGNMNAKPGGTAPARPEATWTDTGKTEHVGSYTCRIWESRFGARLDAQYCVVPKGSLAGGDELIAAMHQVSSLAHDIMAAFPVAAEATEREFAAFEKLNGYPVLVRHFSGDAPSTEYVVQSVDHQSVAADKFVVPAGFKEKPAFGGSHSG